MDENPYAPPTTPTDAKPLSESEVVRNEHIANEASVRSLGTLYVTSGPLMVLIAGITALEAPGDPDAGAVVGVSIGSLSVGVILTPTAFGLWRFQPWARRIAIITSVFGLCAIPFGTVMCVYVLYLLLSRKGAFVFSEDYKQVIADTPHIRYGTSPLIWLAFVVLVIPFIALVALAVWSGQYY